MEEKISEIPKKRQKLFKITGKPSALPCMDTSLWVCRDYECWLWPKMCKVWTFLKSGKKTSVDFKWTFLSPPAVLSHKFLSSSKGAITSFILQLSVGDVTSAVIPHSLLPTAVYNFCNSHECVNHNDRSHDLLLCPVLLRNKITSHFCRFRCQAVMDAGIVVFCFPATVYISLFSFLQLKLYF